MYVIKKGYKSALQSTLGIKTPLQPRQVGVYNPNLFATLLTVSLFSVYCWTVSFIRFLPLLYIHIRLKLHSWHITAEQQDEFELREGSD